MAVAGAFVSPHSSSCSLSGSHGLDCDCRSISPQHHYPSRHREDAIPKGPARIPPNPPISRTHSGGHGLRRLTQPSPSALQLLGCSSTTALVVSVLVMSAGSLVKKALCHSRPILPGAGYGVLMSHLTDIYIVRAALNRSTLQVGSAIYFKVSKRFCSRADLPSISALASRCW